jgi:four helix bundle protein
MKDFLFPFEKLNVWQMAVDLAQKVLNILENLPPNKHIRLINQMESAATSPAQNIAEGRGRQYKKEFIQFLYIAEGSVFEVVTLNEIFRRNEMFTNEQASDIRGRCEEIDRKLVGLIKSLREKT